MLKHAQTFTVNSSLFCITPDDVSESIRNIDSGSERERKPTSDIKTPSLFRSYISDARREIQKRKAPGLISWGLFEGPIEEKLRFQNLLGL